MSVQKVCPGEETLLGFLSGTLQTEEFAEVERHISRCGICDVLVERMRAFDQPVEPGPEWASVEARLENRFSDAFSKGKAKRAPWIFLWNPILAYAMVAALIYPAYLGLRPEKLTVRAATLENIRVIQLDASRSAAPATPTPQASGDPVALSFFFPVRDGFRYSASLVGPSGRRVTGPVEAHTSDGLGHFALTYSSAPLAPGIYSLHLEEQDSSGALTRTGDYQFSR